VKQVVHPFEVRGAYPQGRPRAIVLGGGPPQADKSDLRGIQPGESCLCYATKSP
jgi:hypothetical protein